MTNTDTSKQTSNLIAQVLSKISGFKDIKKFHVGLSGGADSHVLLAIAAELKKAGHIKELQAIHINHSINDSSDTWEEHCKQIASELNIPCKTITIKLSSLANLESNARDARYAEFAKLVKKDEAILLAHHLDDQLETILMRLFKGTGATGICGIKDATTIQNITVLRPLLDVPKEQLLSFAREHNLRYINDPSNEDCDLDRNYIRHNIIPSIKTKWPQAAQNVLRSVSHINCQEEYIKRYSQINLQKISAENRLSITGLKSHTQPEQQLLLRAWIMQHNIYAPSSQTLERIFKELINAKIDRNPIININNIQLRRFKNHIYLLPNSPGQDLELEDINWPGSERTIYIPAINKTLQRDGAHMDLIIKFRSGGEQITGYQNKYSKSLKKFMHEREVPPWERNRIPLIYYNNELICVAGLFLAEKYKPFNISYL